jgi:3',5'-cyclic AMP phosphodiesterase CpdA
MNEMQTLSRRSVLAAAGSVAILPAFGAGESASRRGSFRLVHATDLHIQPELGAADGVSLCVKKILELSPRPDFVITGGDHVMDVLEAPQARADLQFALLAERLKPLEMPIYHCVGNHDVFGWSPHSPVTANDPEYGKALFQEKIREGKTYYSFDHKNWHFIVLDSIGIQNGAWMGAVDDDQLQWLKDDLSNLPPTTPVVVQIHMPILTAIVQETESATGAANIQTVTSNGKQVYDLLKTRNVKLVLQGHTHIVESIDYLGVRFYTGGAVCGDWWKGWRLGVHPEGFNVLDFNGEDVKIQYVPYGWKARTS